VFGSAIGNAGKPPEPPPVSRARFGIASPPNVGAAKAPRSFGSSFGCLRHGWNLPALVSTAAYADRDYEVIPSPWERPDIGQKLQLLSHIRVILGVVTY
jgi:hypothetical protein